MENYKEKGIKTCTLQELLKIVPHENYEHIVILNNLSSNIICEYEKHDMEEFLGKNIVAREEVAKKLILVANKLNEKYPGYKLKVVYGYRHPDVQLKYFENRKSLIRKENQNLTDDELNEKTHKFVADPRVAGHPTGGAVDITIITPNGDLDMGTKIADFDEPDRIPTFSGLITEVQHHNRILLHDLMKAEGFAPFYGEWWHFSYGDIEWACFYNKESSLYSQKSYHI